MLSISVSGVTCDKRSLCSCYISRDARFFLSQFKCFWKHVVKSWIGVTVHVICIVKMSNTSRANLAAQHSAWFFLLSGATVRSTLQSSLSPESLLSLINFEHIFKQIIRCITKCICSTDTFVVFLSKWNDIIVWIYQQNIMCVTWDKPPCTGIPVLNDARFFHISALSY